MLKSVSALCLSLFTVSALAAAPLAPGEAAPAAAPALVGQVLEVKDASGFSYLRLKTRDGETWAAVARGSFQPGMLVTIDNVLVTQDFESRALRQKFPKIVFGDVSGMSAGTSVAAPAAVASVGKPQGAEIKVARASGENAYTVAEIIAKAVELKGKPVSVRGMVVKFNPEIMKKNWVHLRDGSGSEADRNNDLLVTTLDQAQLDSVVTVQGIVHTDKDFGSGYAYRVMIEEAKLLIQ